MELISSTGSPFGRKVLVVAHELGIADRITLTAISPRVDPAKLTSFNPLCKIPVLVTDAGAVLYDSGVICEYLDTEFGSQRFLPASGAARWEGLTRAALADGLLDAGVSVRYERNRPAGEQSEIANAWQLKKVYAGLDTFEAEAENFGDTLDLARICLVCGIDFLTHRIDELKDMSRWPHLAKWVARMNQRPSFRITRPQF